MPSFQDMFRASSGQAVEHNGRQIHMVDRLPVAKVQKIGVAFEGVNSDWRQGVHLSTDGSFDVNGQTIKKAIILPVYPLDACVEK